MRAFEVFVNGKKRCVAGVGSNESLSVIASIALDQPFLSVGGCTGSNADFARWVESERIDVGDEIRIRLVDVGRVDKPTSITRGKRKATLRR
jgi:hypothetical protein